MTKKNAEPTLRKHIKVLQDKLNEVVVNFNASQDEHRAAFGMVAKDIKALRGRVEHLENILLIGNFKAKIADKL